MTGSPRPLVPRRALMLERACVHKPVTRGLRVCEFVATVHCHNSSLSLRNKVTGCSTGRKWRSFLWMAFCCFSPFYLYFFFLSLLYLPSSLGITRSQTNWSVGDANWHWKKVVTIAKYPTKGRPSVNTWPFNAHVHAHQPFVPCSRALSSSSWRERLLPGFWRFASTIRASQHRPQSTTAARKSRTQN